MTTLAAHEVALLVYNNMDYFIFIYIKKLELRHYEMYMTCIKHVSIHVLLLIFN